MTLSTSEPLREESAVRPERSPRARRRVSAGMPAIPLLSENAADAPLVKAAPPRSWETLYGLLCSIALHGTALFAVSFLILESSRHEATGVYGGFNSSVLDGTEDFIIDSAVNLDPGGSTEPSDLFSDSASFGDLGTSAAGAVGAADAAGQGGQGVGAGEGDGAGDGAGVAVPAINIPGRAVTKGSFSAWTEPEDPEPLQRYVICIVVRLPGNFEKSTKYRLRDISGLVIGTDGYKQYIRFKPTQTSLIQDGAVQIDVSVPGASRLVRDTIRIESKLLKEKQVIQLVF